MPNEQTVGVVRAVEDQLHRPLRDLRISLTDRCNFRCPYCMPREKFGPDFAFLPRRDLLSFEEIVRLARIFAKLGVSKLRLTGGEPLLRAGVEELVRQLTQLPGIQDIALTTNGSLLTKEKAAALQKAGLRRITISLDSLDQAVFSVMNGVHFGVDNVLSAISHAKSAELWPVKVNVVVRRGVNEDSIANIAGFFRGTGVIPRFIEFMDVGNTNGWKLDDVVPAREIFSRISGRWPLVAVDPNYPGEVAQRYRYADGNGEIGIIASVTRAFCGTCTRARLSPEGQLLTCLFASGGVDLRALLRSGETDETITAAITSTWRGRRDRYSEIRSSETAGWRKVEMSHIGG